MTQAGESVSATVGDRLANVARHAPERIALVEHRQRLSFAMLDAAADAIASALMAAGARDACGGGARVALLFTRRVPAIASIFGSARAGCAYVPLDADDPERRLRDIVDDCEPAVLLTEASHAGLARALAPRGCVVIDAVEAINRPSHAVPPVVDADDPLYLYYTSGSTGKPKAVVQTHRHLLFFADAYARGLAITAQDRHSLVYSLSFNAANMDIYGALLTGATLAVRDLRGGGLDEAPEWLDRERISILHTVPTVFRDLCTRVPPARVFPHLRVVDLGGEAVYATDVDLFRAHSPDSCMLVNQLASTEVGLIAQHRIGHADRGPATTVVPVGRSPQGVRVEIIRDDGSPAPAGESGEIVVCSEHVCAGYWRRPELDSQVFSPDPSRPRERRYRSGDLGFVDADGNLHFRGRRGSRVKVRGHSVDLAEIDAALAACPGVARAAVVVAQSDGASDSARLVACVSPRGASQADPRLVRQHLALRLPSYMLPAAIVFVDALPLTASGKIDRRELASSPPVVAASRPAVTASERSVEPPCDDCERAIAQVFEDLLHLVPVGRADDFYLLGGDSLLASELQQALRERFGVHIGTLHDEATVAAIAVSVRRAQAAGMHPTQPMPVLVPLWREGGKVPLFLVHGRHGQAFVSPHFMRLLGDDQPVYAFQARGLDGIKAPHASVEAMADDYLAALRAEQPQGPYFIGALCAGAYVAAVMARRLSEANEVVLPLLLLDPPGELRGSGYAELGKERFAAKITARRALGGSAGPAENPGWVQSVWRVAQAFETALAAHHPQPYMGPAYMLASRQRIGGASPDTLLRVFAGTVRRFEIGATHRDALDPRNPVFAGYLERCLGLIRGAYPARPAVVLRMPEVELPR